MHFLNISCDPSLLLSTFHSKIIMCPHLYSRELGSWCQFREETEGIGPVYFFQFLFSEHKQNAMAGRCNEYIRLYLSISRSQ
jgi:hypothetical protein